MPTPTTSEWPHPKSEDEWESMVLDATKSIWNDPASQRNGRRGQRQNGVDIVCRRQSDNGLVGIQCKNSRTIQSSAIDEEIAKAESFDPALQEYYFAVAGPRDATLQNKVRLLSKARIAQDRFSVGVLFFDDICHELSTSPKLVSKHWPGWKNHGSLAVVDISISDDSSPTVIDIKVRNTGVDVCFIKRVRLQVLNVGTLDILLRRFIQKFSTGEYDAGFDPNRQPPYLFEIPVSQVVEDNETDRFQIGLGYVPGFDWWTVNKTLVQAQVSIAFNEDSETAPRLVLFSISPPRIVRGGRTVTDTDHVRRAKENISLLERMLWLDGEASPVVQKLREAVSQRHR